MVSAVSQSARAAPTSQHGVGLEVKNRDKSIGKRLGKTIGKIAVTQGRS